MKKYKAIYLQQDTDLVTGEDVLLDFIIVNEEGTIQTDLSSWTFNADLQTTSTEIQLAWGTEVTATGVKVTVAIANTVTDDLAQLSYEFELVGELNSKKYHLYFNIFNFRKENLSWD